MQPPKCRACGKSEWNHVCRPKPMDADGNRIRGTRAEARIQAPAKDQFNPAQVSSKKRPDASTGAHLAVRAKPAVTPSPPKIAEIDKPDETARALAQLRRKREYMRGYMKRYRAQLAKAE